MNFTEAQIERYSRHIILPEVGGQGQARLLDSSVLVVGAGGLGSPAVLFLAAAGVGTLGIIDADTVDLSNLQRQILHTTADVGGAKTASAERKVRALNPDVAVRIHQTRLSASNALDILPEYDFVLDGTDNFPSKVLVADACHFAGKPYSHAGILGFIGQTITVVPGETTCYRCLFREPPPPGAVPSCSQAGVLGVLPGVVGSVQATEAIKCLLVIGEMLVDRLLIYDALAMTFRIVRVSRSVDCPLCGRNPSIRELVDEQQAVCDLRSSQ